jgi:D-glycero-D-manno-heptose 1,7-bisphosphate phosphatase
VTQIEMYPALFLDRDGVINENRPNYVRSWQDVMLLPQAMAALVQAAQLPYKIIIVTNQSAVDQGLMTLASANSINERLVNLIEGNGGRIDGVYLCPHRAEGGCACRKPKPGLLLTAARDLHLDLSASIMIGDALTDIMAGQAAGVRHTILVRTGRGAVQAALPQAATLPPFTICDTLATAVAAI